MGHHTQFHPGVLLSKHLRFQDSVVIQKKEKKEEEQAGSFQELIHESQEIHNTVIMCRTCN